MRRLLVGSIGVLLAAAAGAQVGFGQQKVEMMPGFPIPVAPRGLWGKKLPEKPVEFDTAEGQRIRVVAVTKELSFPWTVAFLPDGNMLVTERAARLRIIRKGVLDPKPIAGVPVGRMRGISGDPGAVHGFMDVVLHPQFAQNKLPLYLLHEADRRQARDYRDRARQVGRRSAHRDEGRVRAERRHGRRAYRVRPRRHALRDDGRRTARRTPNSQGGKVLRLQRRWHGAGRQPVRRQEPVTGPRSTRSATAARSASR